MNPMNTYSYLGSQFDENRNEGIDPRILRLDEQQRASRANQARNNRPTSGSFNHQHFGHDFGQNTAAPPAAAGLQWRRSLPNRPATPNDRIDTSVPSFGLHGVPHGHPVLPITPPSTINSHITPRHRRLRELQDGWRPSHATSHNQEALQSPTQPWQQNNPFALLDPDLDDSLAQDVVMDGNLPMGNRVSWPPHGMGCYQNEPFPNFDDSMPATPPYFHSQIANTGTQNNGGTFITPESLSQLPDNPHSNETMGQWNQQTYHPTGPMSPARLATPMHTPNGRHRKRTSRATSVTSTQAGGPICNVCHKLFERRHELNHHYRWHEDPTHTCEDCGKKFVAKKDLRRHKKTHNKAERHIFCNILGCKYRELGFQRQDHFKRHVERMHRNSLLSPSAPSSCAGG